MDGNTQFRYLLFDYVGLILVLLVLVTAFSLSTDHFFTVTNFRTIANQVPDSVVIAVGMTFVLIVAGIDLSVGSVLALSGSVLGVCLARLDTILSQSGQARSRGSVFSTTGWELTSGEVASSWVSGSSGKANWG